MAQAEREQLTAWLAHGHINPYLELARRLTSSNHGDLDVTVHLISTPANLAALAHRQTDRIPFPRVVRGKALRRRAGELREVVARNDADGAQVGDLVRRMARLCGKGQRVAVPN